MTKTVNNVVDSGDVAGNESATLVRVDVAQRILALDAQIGALPPTTMWDRVVLILAGGVFFVGFTALAALLGLDDSYGHVLYLLTALVAFQFPMIRHGVTSSGRQRLRLEREMDSLAEVAASS